MAGDQQNPAGPAPSAPGGAAANGPADLSALRIDKASLAPRKSRARLFWYVLPVALAAVALWLWRSGALTPAVEVRTAMVGLAYPSQTFTRLTASGYVVAQRRAAVAAQTTALLTELYVAEGDRVRAGQVLARLDDREPRAAAERAAAQLTAAEQGLREAQAEQVEATLDYDRRRRLLAGEVISRSEFDAAEARYRRAEAAVRARQAEMEAARAARRQAEVNLSYTQVRAPFDAVVLTKDADVGDIVTPIGAAAGVRASVVTIADLTSLQVEADVSESSIGQVRQGQPAEIQLDALPGERFSGTVHMIVPTADRSKASVQVKVAFDFLDKRILPQMSAKAAFLERAPTEAERKPILAAPAKAVEQREGKAAAFVVEGGQARRVEVAVGRTFGDLREVLSGLSEGQRVALSPPPGLEDGRKVKVLE